MEMPKYHLNVTVPPLAVYSLYIPPIYHPLSEEPGPLVPIKNLSPLTLNLEPSGS